MPCPSESISRLWEVPRIATRRDHGLRMAALFDFTRPVWWTLRTTTHHPLCLRALTDSRPDNYLYAFATESRQTQEATRTIHPDLRALYRGGKCLVCRLVSQAIALASDFMTLERTGFAASMPTHTYIDLLAELHCRLSLATDKQSYDRRCCNSPLARRERT